MINMQFKSSLLYLSIGFLLSLGLSACDYHSEQHQRQDTQTQPKDEVHSKKDEASISENNAQGMPLTQAVGQAALPQDIQNENIHLPTGADLAYVGRYHVQIPCSDAFAGCTHGEKEAEYIINLSDSGKVYWTNTSFGRLSSDSSRHTESKIEQTCRHVHWYTNLAEKELVIRCDAADVSFYYDIDANHNLVFNLDKIWNADDGRSRKFFQEYPFPQKAYIFERID